MLSGKKKTLSMTDAYEMTHGTKSKRQAHTALRWMCSWERHALRDRLGQNLSYELEEQKMGRERDRQGGRVVMCCTPSKSFSLNINSEHVQFSLDVGFLCVRQRWSCGLSGRWLLCTKVVLLSNIMKLLSISLLSWNFGLSDLCLGITLHRSCPVR